MELGLPIILGPRQPPALLGLHLVSNNSQEIPCSVLSQHKHLHSGEVNMCVHLSTGSC